MMEKRNKRRITHLGEHASKKKKNVDGDVVTNMVKQMDAIIFDPRNQKLNEILMSKAEEKVSRQSNSSSTPLIANQRSMTSYQKKILRSQRHPLMEKVQKNINYIKHNRKMPKPRAHLGGINQTNEKEKLVKNSMQSSSKLKNTRSICVSNKKKKNLSNCQISTSSHKSDSDESFKSNDLPNLSSDSESDYEHFILSQRQELNEDQTNKRSKGKGKIKLKKDKPKRLKNASKKKCNQGDNLKLQKLKSNDDEMINKRITRHKSRISSKLTQTNRLMLSDTSDEGSDNENELLKTKESVEKENNEGSANENELLKTKESVEKENNKVPEQLNIDNLNCVVRIERMPSLEETVNQLRDSDLLQESKPFSKDQCSSELQDQQLKRVNNPNDEIVLDSDDECMIVNEVPKSSAANPASVTQTQTDNDSLSGIQILDVMSLQEGERDNESNFLNFGSGINFEKLKEAIEIARIQESHSNHFSLMEKTSAPTKKLLHSETYMMENLHSAKGNDLTEENCLPVPVNIIETLNKIDFKQILSLSGNQSIKCSSISNVNMLNSSPCSSSSIDEPPSFTRLPFNKAGNIPESIWQNLKTLVVNNCLQEENHSTSGFFESQSRNANSVQSENNTNSFSNALKPSPLINSDLNSSTLKEILLNAERLTGQGEGHVFQDGGYDTCQLKTKYFEKPCDELDILTTAKIQELCHCQNSQAFFKLLNSFSGTSHEYTGEKLHENVTLGLKMLQEIEANKKKQAEVVVEHIIKHDPCFYSSVVEQVGTITRSSKTNSIQIPKSEETALSEQVKKCVNCGSKASIGCTRCMKIFFCSEKCGVFYWENKHYSECSGLNEENI